MTETNEWREAVRNEYQDAVKSLEGDSGVARQEAFLLAQGRLLELVEVGELRIDPVEAIRHELYRADDEQGSLADRFVQTLASGQGLFDIEGDPLAGTVVILGNGRRKTWANVTHDDLIEMDAIRYKNFRAQSDAYDEWRRGFEVLAPVVAKFTTVGHAIAAGALSPADQVAS